MNTISKLWAKTSQLMGPVIRLWHPLVLHLLDVAACADAILDREPEVTRKRLAEVLGMAWEDARSWILLMIACHDLGKACPGFQCKWDNLTGLPLPKIPNTDINHAFVSQIVLTEILLERDWPEGLAILVADAVGCHHGERISERNLQFLEGNRNALGSIDWANIRRDIFDAVFDVLQPARTPDKQILSGPDFMLLSGLTSFADWIGSNDKWFPFGTPEECEDLLGWFKIRKACAERALDAIGWNHRTLLSLDSRTFEQVFKFPPRPLQQAVADALATLQVPSILLIEAPMGEGKTEAAFFAHLEMQRRFGHRGLYMALPTKATGNAMFKRTLKFICDQGKDRKLDLQLVHGATLLNDTYQNLRFTGIHDPETGGEIRAGEWFTNKKRALLSEYGVGTVDQAIVPILSVRHNFVRLWGLANRVVVFDEIHAYDAYTGTLLIHLIHWLLELGSSVVLLSATLPPRFRRELANKVKTDFPEQEPEYPRLSVFSLYSVCQTHFEADPSRRLTLQLHGIAPELQCIKTALDEHLVNGGMGLALVNTVQRAQDLYRLFPDGEPLFRRDQNVGKHLADGTEVYLFHARYPADRRQQREEQALSVFGEDGDRTGRKILIATQVVEQSLDLDFDLIVTDLAPIDLILQRAGRLWRHKRGYRPLPQPVLIVAGLAGEEPPSFGKPLWWGEVYREDMLLCTWILLREDKRQTLTLPDEIDVLVEKVYEEQVTVPEPLQERMNQAVINSEGKTIPLRGQANQAIIGLPDDASWNDPGRYVLYDEDAPGMHRTLMARTRQGSDSVVAITLFYEDDSTPDTIPDFAKAKQWFMRAVSLSRNEVIRKLRSGGIPEGWQKSSLLRNCYPMILDKNLRWIEDTKVRLDDELGIVYERKEGE
ncbi:MAG: CRISPR-associated helicase Cas3' [Pedobacter sp.]